MSFTTDQKIAIVAIIVAIIIGVPAVWYARRAVVKPKREKRKDQLSAQLVILRGLVDPINRMAVAALSYQADSNSWTGYRDARAVVRSAAIGLPSGLVPSLADAIANEDRGSVRSLALAAQAELADAIRNTENQLSGQGSS